jgi:hypothetical protein
MTLVEVIEIAQSSAAKRVTYSRIIFFVIAAMLVLTMLELSGSSLATHPRELIDFDDFYLAGQLIWRGGPRQLNWFNRATRGHSRLARVMRRVGCL